MLKFSIENQIKDTITPNLSGNYYVKFELNGLNCPSNSSVFTINRPITSLTSSAGQFVCDGSSTTLSTTSNSTYTYQWKKNNVNIAGATSNTYVANQTGTYKVVVTDTNGCQDSPTNFTINPLPTVTLTNTGICSGDTLITNAPGTFVSEIIWRKNGQVIQSELTKFNPIGTSVANNSQGYSWSGDVHLDKDGAIYFSDGDNHRVMKYDTTTATFTVVAGGNGQGNALNQLNVPYGIFVDAAKNVFVADHNNHRVVRWAPGATAGVVVAGNGTQGSGVNQLNGPVDVALDNINRVYVSEIQGHRVTRWATSSLGVVVAGQGGPGSGLNQLNNPYNLFFGSNNDLYISDYSNNRVVKYAANATSGTIVAGGVNGNTGLNQLNGPVGVFVDNSLNVYVTEYNNNRVVRWKPNATIGELVVGGTGGGHLLNQTSNPRGVYLDGNKIYVTTSNYANRVMQFTAIPFDADTLIVTSPGTYKAQFISYSQCLGESTPINIYRPITSMSSSAGIFVCDGNSTTLTTTSNPSYTYQWRKNNVIIPGATANTYLASLAGTYKVFVTDSLGCQDSPATFTINALPAATLASVNFCGGNDLVVNMSDTSSYGITWYYNNSVIKSTLPSYDTIGTLPFGSFGSLGIGATRDMFVSNNGDYYFTDGNNHRVVKFAAGTTGYTVVAGGNGAGAGLNQLNNPWGIFVDNANNVYVADQSNHRVVRWAPGATTGIIVAGTGTPGANLNLLNNPTDVWVDNNNQLYVVDRHNHRVVRWAPNATVGILVAGNGVQGGSLSQLNYPFALFIKGSDLYVTDTDNHRVVKYSIGSSQGVKVAGGSVGTNLNQLQNPLNVYVDKFDNVFVADYNNHRIVRWSPGSLSGTNVAGGNGNGSGLHQTPTPIGMNIDNLGNLEVLCNDNSRLMEFTLDPFYTDTIIPNNPGSYYVSALNVKTGCSANSSVVTIQQPIVNLTSSLGEDVCFGDTTVLSTPSNTNYTYVWKKNGITLPQTTNSLTVSTPGSYTVTATQTNGCNKTSENFVIEDSVAAYITSNDLCLGAMLTSNLPDSNVQSIEWYKDGQVIKLVLPEYEYNGQIFAGNGLTFNGLNINQASDVTRDKEGSIYVSDYSNHRVVKINPSNATWEVVAGGSGPGNALSQLEYPTGIYVDDTLNVYVADSYNHRVVKWAKNATVGVVVAGVTDSAGVSLNRLNSPADVQLDQSGNLYVSDRFNHRVVKWLPGASSGTIVGGTNQAGAGLNQLHNPQGILLKDGDLYVADYDNHRIMKFNPNMLNGIIVLGGNGSGPYLDQISHPYALAIDKNDNFYITQHQNHRVVRWQLNGLQGEEIIGNGQSSSTLHQLSNPAGIHYDVNGDILVADFNNSRIIQFEPLLLGVDSLQANANGAYSLTFSTYNGCENSSDIYDVNGPQFQIASTNGFNLCLGDTSVVSVVSNTTYAYQWLQDGLPIMEANSSSLTIYEIGEYQVMAEDTNGCQVTSNSVQINLSDTVTLAGTTACLGSVLTPTFNNSGYQISWYLNGNLYDKKVGNFDSLGFVIAGNNVGGVNIWNATDIFIDDEGDYYISDFANHRVIRVASDGNSWNVVAGGYGDGNWSNQLSSPMGVFVDKDKNIYVADRNNHRVMKWAPGATTGMLVAGSNGIPGSTASMLNNPIDVVLDNQGAMYISDNGNNRVVKWLPGATSGIVVAGNGTAGNTLSQLNSPYGISVDVYGRLFVADRNNHRILKYNPGVTTGILVAGGNGNGSSLNQTSFPEWITVDKSENIYLSDHVNYRILRFKNGILQGEKVAAGNGPGGALNQLYHPTGIALDSSANLHIMDGNWMNNRLLRYGFNEISNSTLIVDSVGVYTVGISNYGGCESMSNPVTIYNPTVTLGNLSSICLSNTPLSLTMGAPLGGSYSGVGVTTTSFNPTTAGVGPHLITYSYTDIHGCEDSATTTIVVDPLPLTTLTVTGALEYCYGGSVSISVNNNGVSQSYQWYQNGTALPSTTNTLTVQNTSGNVYVQVTRNSCVQNSSTLAVVVNPLPVVNAGPNSTICLGNAATLSTTGTNTYFWSNILQPLTVLSTANSLTVSPVSNSTYLLKGTSAAGCINYDTVAVNVNPLPVVDAGSPQTLCFGNSVTLNGSGALSYVWNNNITNGISFNPSQTTMYQVVGTDVNGCSKSDSVLVTVNQLPNVNAGVNDSICLGNSYTLNGTGALSYVWNNGVTNNVPFTPNASSNYIVTGTDINGCQKSDTMNLTVLALPVVSISTLDSTVICQGDTVNITSSVNAIVSYVWYNTNTNINQSGSAINVLASGSYSLLVEDEFGCENTSDTISVTVHQYPLATITPGSSLILCNGENVELNANQGPLLTYSWQLIGNPIPGGNTDSLVVSSAGTYQLVTTYDGLCSTTSTPVTVVVNPLPIVSIAFAGPQEVCQGDTVFFTATANSIVSYQWYGSNGNAIQNQSLSTFNTTVPGTYYVEAENEFGCTQNSNSLAATNYLLPQQIIDICAVTVDTATNANKVLWAKPSGAYRVWYYNIYRETSIAGQYGIVGSVLDTALTEYVDVLANPSVQSYRYKIAHVDSCGIESAKSELHRTIHLSSNSGINGEINLSWNSYEGFAYPTFDILRSVNGSPFVSIAQISSNSNSYTDLNPPAGVKNYMISVDIPNGGCTPNKSFGSTISNRISVGTASLSVDLENNIEVYPNPSNGIFNIVLTDISGDQNRKFEIVNAIGQLVMEFDMESYENKKAIDLSAYANGLYFLKQKDGNWMKQLILNQ
jgi:sugar lactone lactonase YvrE